jgi:hypothetical protein
MKRTKTIEHQLRRTIQMSKKAIDLTETNPTSKTQLTKENMYNFIKQRNNKEDAQWFVDLMREHRKDVPLNSGKAKSEKGKSYDFAYIREEFAKKFFKEISDEYKKAQKKTFDDELTELLNSFDAA